MRRRLAAPLAALLLAAPSLAVTQPAGGSLECLGRDPGFMLSASGSEVRLDYLGDGVFELDPPLASPDFTFRRHALRTSRELWSVYFEARDCSAFGATLDYAVEIAVPTASGLRPLRGCCVWRETATVQ
jgi:hypothetical protein